MRLALLGGVSLAVLASSPTLAKPAPVSNRAILERLNALEAKVDALQQRNAELEHALADQKATTAAVAARPVPPAKAPSAVAQATPAPAAAAAAAPGSSAPKATTSTQWTIVPQFVSPDGNFTFKPRGILDIDYAGFNERRGGYDYNNGTSFRRGRFGFDGTAYKQFAWRIEGEWIDNKANLLDAYVAYTGVKNFTFTLGQLKVPAGLEANTSDSFNEFMERGMANTAFGQVGGERRVGATFAYANKLVTATAGIYGGGEAVDRNATTPGEVWSYNGRVTLEPINDTGRLLHVGASAYHVVDLAANSVTLADRPNVRVDGGNLESVTITGGVSATGVKSGVKDATFYGLEGAGILGPFAVQGEYSHMHLDRYLAAPSLNFDGFYVYGSLFLTGESRSFKNGTVDRLRPTRPFDPSKGNYGAVELAVRYDRIDLTDHALSPLNREGHSWTGAVNWYLNGNMRLMFNYIRFTGENSPLVAAPVSINGTTAKGDAFATRLHFDF
ncbi:MAG TPA: porin [Sphingomonas sp.]|nr:porin [Sphingomonas sp.]